MTMNRQDCFKALARHVTDEVVIATYSSAVEWNDLGPRVPEQQRPPRLHVVQQAVSVGVLDEGAFAADKERGRAADGAEGPHRRVDPAGDDPAGAFEQFLGAGHRAPRALYESHSAASAA